MGRRKRKTILNPKEIVDSYGRELSYKNDYKISTKKIICLGLGNLELRAPKYQLAFLLEISKQAQIVAYDPIWTEQDLDLLSNYPNISISKLDSYKVREDTLFVMFHCPHELLDKVVESNLDNLDLVTILCNDFNDYKTDNTKFLSLKRAANHCNLVQTLFELEHFHSNVFSGCFWHSWKKKSDDLKDFFSKIEI